MGCYDAMQEVEAFFRSWEVAHCRMRPLGKASVITVGCSRPKSSASGTIDVDILVHTKQKFGVSR